MDHNEKIELQRMYEQEVSDEDLIEMALVDPSEYDHGVYELVLKALKARGLFSRLDDVKKGRRDFNGQVWVEVCRFNDITQKNVLEAFFRDKKIETRVFLESGSPFNPSASQEGVIKVKEDALALAKKMVEDFNDADEGDGLLVDEGIKKAIINVLSRHNIADKEVIIEEIIREIDHIYKDT
jgi:hypothetical protein